MKLSLLQIVQDVLSRMSSDEVNSISDTTESMQVATIVKNKYYDIIARADLPELKQLIQLDPSNDPDLPVLMTIPQGVSKVEWIKYFDTKVVSNTAVPGYKYVYILPNDQFIDMVNSFNPDETDVRQYTFVDNANNYPNSFTLYYKNGFTPSYCSIFSNYYVLFDTYDVSQDDTLQASKMLVSGKVMPVFLMEDTFVPDLDDMQFPLLLSEVTALAFYELKQMIHQKAEQEVKRQWNSAQRNKAISSKPTAFEQLPNFGRWAGGWGYSNATRPRRTS